MPPDASAQTAPSAATIAGLPATCVSVPLTADGAATYCVLENGLLARMDNGDVLIELTSFRDGVDETGLPRRQRLIRPIRINGPDQAVAPASGRSAARSSTRTCPAIGSTSMRSPSPIAVIASRQPITDGIDSSRAITAA